MTNISCAAVGNVIIYGVSDAAMIFCAMDVSVIGRDVMEERF